MNDSNAPIYLGSHNVVYADYIKNSYNSIRKANNPIKKKAEDIKEDIRKTNKHMKIFNIMNHWKNTH